MQVIRTEDFCREVAERLKIDPRWILEIVGCMANLYLEESLRTNGIFEAETDGFSSLAIPRDRLIIEIRNCSGASLEMSNTILVAMQEVLKDLFIRDGIAQSDHSITIESLGKFEIRDIKRSLFYLRYCDPARSSYDDFLIS
jgi:hypothetical protein